MSDLTWTIPPEKQDATKVLVTFEFHCGCGTKLVVSNFVDFTQENIEVPVRCNFCNKSFVLDFLGVKSGKEA